MPPHRALYISEILLEILEYLPAIALSRLARSAQLFYVPASSLLWRTLIDHPIFVNLAEVALDKCVEGDTHQLPTGDTWMHFELYASFVHELRLCFNMDWRQGTRTRNALSSLAMSKPSQCLLPFLRSIDIITYVPEDLMHVQPCLSPTLIVLKLTCLRLGEDDLWKTNFTFFLTCLGERRPNLQHLYINGMPSLQPAGVDLLRSTITCMPSLEIFSGNALLPDLLSGLAGLPRLRRLDVLCDDFPHPSEVSGSIGKASFERLRWIHVDMGVNIIKHIIQLLKHIPSRLEIIELNCFEEHNAVSEEIVPLAEAIRLFAGSLKSLSLSFEDSADRDTLPLIWDTFRPVLDCRLMTSFEFYYPSRGLFSFNDADLTSIARAWPLLEDLGIIWGVGEDIEENLAEPVATGLTWYGLCTLRSHCPKLRSLSLFCFVTSLKYTIPVQDNRPVDPKHSFHLNVGFSRLESEEDVQSIAVLLHALWGDVQISTEWHEQEEEELPCRLWEEVEGRIRKMLPQYALA